MSIRVRSRSNSNDLPAFRHHTKLTRHKSPSPPLPSHDSPYFAKNEGTNSFPSPLQVSFDLTDKPRHSDNESLSGASSTDSVDLPIRVRKKALKRKLPKTNPTADNPPDDWEELFTRLATWRRNNEAPVDVVGCHCLADTSLEPKVVRFQHLVSLMLSSQTKDATTAAAVKNLQTKLTGGLTPQAVVKAGVSAVDACIDKVGFHQNKAKYVVEAASRIITEFGGDIPKTVEGLTSLKGVGPKMAFLCMQVAWDKTVGIGVDVHVHRISNRFGWAATTKSTPVATQKALEGWLPQSKWRELNPLLVGFG